MTDLELIIRGSVCPHLRVKKADWPTEAFWVTPIRTARRGRILVSVNGKGDIVFTPDGVAKMSSMKYSLRSEEWIEAISALRPRNFRGMPLKKHRSIMDWFR